MENLLLIETATSLCSVALAVEGRTVALRESTEARAHAALTAVFVDEVLKEAALTASDLSAVCVSAGPGSYTGLRVGVSTAKGLCLGAGLPLIAVDTLDILVARALTEAAAGGWPPAAGSAAGLSEADAPEDAAPRHIVAMIDARHDEYFLAQYDVRGRRERETWSEIITPDTFRALLDEGPVLFVGDENGKAPDLVRHPAARYLKTSPRAQDMLAPARRAFAEGRFADTAYFEPFYLKEFSATVSKKNLW